MCQMSYVFARLLFLVLIVTGVGIVTEGRVAGQKQAQWNSTALQALFPKPLKGFEVSAMKLKELKTFAQKSGLEQMERLSSSLNGQAPLPPEVRYYLSRTYQGTLGKIDMSIDSEDIESVGLVWMTHGYSEIKDGKPIPLKEKQKASQKQILDNGIRPFTHAGYMGVRAAKSEKAFMLIVAGRYGVVSFSCEYSGCDADQNELLERLRFEALDGFANYLHRKPVKN